MLARQSYSRLWRSHWGCNFFRTFSEGSVLIAVACYRGRLPSSTLSTPTRNNQRQKYMMKKTSFGCNRLIGRPGPHLTIVTMIFVTQNNFKNGPGISDRLLGFYRFVLFCCCLFSSDKEVSVSSCYSAFHELGLVFERRHTPHLLMFPTISCHNLVGG